MRRVWLIGLFAAAILVAEAAPVRADMAAGPWPWQWRRAGPSVNRWRDTAPDQTPAEDRPPQTPQPQPTPQQGAIDPATGTPYPPPAPTEPKRTGPFRSCGSGMGLGLAGIGVAWAMLWLGNRFAKSVRSPAARG